MGTWLSENKLEMTALIWGQQNQHNQFGKIHILNNLNPIKNQIVPTNIFFLLIILSAPDTSVSQLPEFKNVRQLCSSNFSIIFSTTTPLQSNLIILKVTIYLYYTFLKEQHAVHWFYFSKEKLVVKNSMFANVQLSPIYYPCFHSIFKSKTLFQQI